MAASNDALGFLCSWQQLTARDKAEGLNFFAAKLEGKAPQRTSAVSEKHAQASLTTTYGGVQLYSYYSYLYYYPTMSWDLDRTPETDDYWVGIYRKGAQDNNYITYQWLKKTAQSSYKIGKLSTTTGIKSRERSEEFELRLFKGHMQRVDAVTNILRGTITDAPTDPDMTSQTFIAEGKELDLDPGISDIIAAVEKFESRGILVGEADPSSSMQDLRKQWDTFTPLQKQLLLPVLEQDALPDRIKKPGPKALDRPEPKLCFPNLGNVKAPQLRLAEDPNDEAPEKIVLTLTLNECWTYIYPVVDVVQGVPAKNAWMGMYYSQRCRILY